MAAAGDRRDRRRRRSGACPPRTSTSATPTTSARRCRGCGCSRASTSAPRCAASRTSRRRARCCSWATTRAATSRPTRTSSRSPSAPTSASSGASTSSPTTSCCRCRASACCASTAPSPRRPRTPSRRSTSGAALLVYPGGDYEVHRPSWESGEGGLRRPQGLHPAGAQGAHVPIVPVVAIGGQETALFLSRGERLARLLGLDRMFRLKVLPISLALPWGLNVGDMLGHIPLPAKITIQVLEPIDVRGVRRDPDVDEAYERGDRRRCRRRSPASPRSARCRCSADARRARHRDRRAAASEIWELVTDPDNYDALLARDHAARARGTKQERARARASRCGCAIGSADIGGLVEVVECDETRDMAWTSITGIDHRVRWRLRESDDGRHEGDAAAVAGTRPGGLLGNVADRLVGADGRDDTRGNTEESGARAGRRGGQGRRG